MPLCRSDSHVSASRISIFFSVVIVQKINAIGSRGGGAEGRGGGGGGHGVFFPHTYIFSLLRFSAFPLTSSARLVLKLYKQLPRFADCIVQELCESRGGRPGLSVLTSLLVSVDVKNY